MSTVLLIFLFFMLEMKKEEEDSTEHLQEGILLVITIQLDRKTV